MKRKLYIGLITVFIVVLGIGGYIAYNYYKDYHKVQITVDNRLLKINLR